MSASTNIADACRELQEFSDFLHAVGFEKGITRADRAEIRRISGRLATLANRICENSGQLAHEVIKRWPPMPYVRWCHTLDELLEAKGYRKEDVDYETMFMQGFYPEEILVRLEKGVGDV